MFYPAFEHPRSKNFMTNFYENDVLVTLENETARYSIFIVNLEKT